MAQNKHAQVRYRALDRCLRSKNKYYYIEDLQKACADAIKDAYCIDEQVSRRQIFKDINYMESEEGFAADIERVRNGKRTYYRYENPDFTIQKMPITDEEINQLKETVIMLNRFKGMPHFEWMEDIANKLELAYMHTDKAGSVIGFEQNIDLKGLCHITPLFDAIVNKKVLTLSYQSFKAPKPVSQEVHPYYLKQYNNRWFLFGLTTTPQKQITNFALDRIVTIGYTLTPYIDKPEDLDFDEYFDDVIGVTIPRGVSKEKIVMRFAGDRYPYIKNKPLHSSQHNYDKEMKISIEVIPNKELIALLLSFGSQVEVLEPQSVRDMMKEHVRTMNRFYK